MRKYNHLIPYFGLFLPSAVALMLYGYLGSFTRFLADDFCSVYYANRLGLLRSIWYWRLNWSGRYTAYGADWVVEKIGAYALPIIPPLSLLFWLIFTITALHLLSRHVFSADTLRPTTFSLGTIFVFAVLVLSPNVPQSMYWWNGMRSYSLPLILLTGYAILFQMGIEKLRSQKELFAGAALSFLLTFMIGGLGETYIAFQLLLFACLFGLEWLLHRDIKSSTSIFLLAGLTGSICSMILVVSAPGNAIRQSFFPPPPNIVQLLQISSVGYRDFILEIIHAPEQITGLVGVTLASAWAGTHSERKQMENHWVSLVIFLGAFLLSFACFVPGVYASLEPPPTRALIIPAFILVAGLMYGGFVMGESFVKPTLVKYSILILAIFLIGYSAVTKARSLLGDREIYIEFAQKWDETDAFILKAKGENQASVQIPGLDNWAGLERPTPKKEYWPNVCYSLYYGIQVYGPRYSE
jgi:hypothetical protein